MVNHSTNRPQNNRRDRVLVFRDHLVYPSETFVLAQGEGLSTFTAYYAGSRRVNGLAPPPGRVQILNNGSMIGWCREVLFKLAGISTFPAGWLQEVNPSLIHAHFGSDGVLALPLRERLGIPLVVTLHGFDINVKEAYARRSFYSHRLYLRKRRELQRRADLFIAVSGFMEKKMLQQGFPGEKTIRHYIGVDTVFFQPDPAIARKPVVLFAGRLVENKGCRYLIRAMGIVQRELPTVELVIIGDGPQRQKLEEMAAGTLTRCRFLGVRSREEMRAWMNRALVFSVPSITAASGESEAFGLVFAEAGAMGLPVVSFATGGIPEAVAHGKTGFLLPERDWRGLAHHITRLITDTGLWSECSRRGRDRANRLFNLHRQTTELEKIYRRVLAGRQQVG